MMHFTPIEHLADGKTIYQCNICEFVTGPAKENVVCTCPMAKGWGDIIKTVLSRIGIRRQGCGGCGRRQQTMNQVGWSITGMVMSTGRYLRDTITSAIRNP